MKFCPNYREVRKRVKRSFVRRFLLLVFLVLVLQIVNSVLTAFSIPDRRELHKKAAQIEQNQAMIAQLQTEAAERELQNEIRLEARKQIQSRSIYALERGKVWTEEDKRVIAENWQDARYDELPNPFPEFAKR